MAKGKEKILFAYFCKALYFFSMSKNYFQSNLDFWNISCHFLCFTVKWRIFPLQMSKWVLSSINSEIVDQGLGPVGSLRTEPIWPLSCQVLECPRTIHQSFCCLVWCICFLCVKWLQWSYVCVCVFNNWSNCYNQKKKL